MSIQGTKREQPQGFDKKYVGLGVMTLAAISPTRKELNAMFENEDSDDDEEIKYLDTDKDGNDRVRLDFWLYSNEIKKYFIYKIWLSDKVAISKDGTKTQFVNTACESIYWPDEDSLPENFKNFMSKDKSEVYGAKIVRKSLKGEGELLNFMRAWLGRLNFFKPTCVVTVDTKKLLKGDFSELRAGINGDFDAPFIPLAGVETDTTDPTKQYQKIFGGAFLPGTFIDFVKNPTKLKNSEYAQGIWDKFEEKVRGKDGKYGFEAYYELAPLTVYDPDKDIAQSETTRKEKAAKEVTTTNSKY